jgi:geranylgeranyl diphosphate synthase type II
MIYALEAASESRRRELRQLMAENPSDKVEKVLAIFRECGIEEWAMSLKDQYLTEAFEHLEDIAVWSVRKEPLKRLAHYLVQRDK